MSEDELWRYQVALTNGETYYVGAAGDPETALSSFETLVTVDADLTQNWIKFDGALFRADHIIAIKLILDAVPGGHESVGQVLTGRGVEVGEPSPEVAVADPDGGG